jgi:hypothetical protein
MLGWHAGANDVDTIETGFRLDPLGAVSMAA